MGNFTTLEAHETLRQLHAHEHGLSHEEASERLKKYGHNKLPESKGDSYPKIFIRQFQDPLIYVLMGAALTVFLLKEPIDASIILFVLFFNAIVGSFQEGKAQNILSALKNLAETMATVLRDGEELIIKDTEIVPGDIITLQEGEKVPADARVILSNNLKVDEAVLTGESNPVFKISENLDLGNQTLGDQKNMVFKGTNVVYGNGKAVVVATGVKTEIGKISKEIESIDTEMPLKANMVQFSKFLIIFASCIAFIIFLTGLGFGKPLKEMFMTVVAMSVSAIPAGLPIALTLILAIGVFRMGKRNALVKRLQAVEGLGQVKVIAVDKTGTITKNEMMVQRLYLGGQMFEIEGSGYDPFGSIYLLSGENEEIKKHHFSKHSPEFIESANILALCANAHVSQKTEKSRGKKQWCVTGDPTEAAILVFARKVGLHREEVLEKNPLVEEMPFDYKTKFKATLHEDGTLAVIGAPEVIFKLCNLSGTKLSEAEEVFNNMSSEGLRMVAFASKKGVKGIEKKIPVLEFGGLMGLRDTLRSEVKASIIQAHKAGIKVVMITGDHKVTAQALAKEAGIFEEGDLVLTGQELNELSREELLEILKKVSVFARVTPEDKLKIIRAYKKMGITIGMTGDGVNDAPSLVAADIGVSMGKIGTEVAKEASDIVLLDDNFKSIIAAIEEGRNIYKTIKKVILYLLSTSFGEILTIFVAILLGWPLPLVATQIIWLNFVTDGFLTVALAAEGKERHLLSEKFNKPTKYLLDNQILKRMSVLSTTMALGTLFVFSLFMDKGYVLATTMTLTTMAVFQWFNAWNVRSDKKSVFATNPFSNIYLVIGVLWVALLQIFAIYHPFMQKLFHTQAIGVKEWLLVIGVASSIIFVEEIRKFIVRKKS